MAILKVARMGHPILRQRAKPVEAVEIATSAFQDFVDSLVATMREYDGAGLAAPQVHVSQRIAVIEVRDNPRYPEAPEIPLTVLVNPTVRVLGQERIEVVEGCLSIPEIRGRVPRFAEVELEARDRHGEGFRRRFSGFPAAVVQHECDHLDGVLFIDRVEDTRSLGFRHELERHGPLG